MLKLPKGVMLILLVAALTTTAAMALVQLLRRDPPPQRLAIEQIQVLSALVTARVQVADVMLVERSGVTGGLEVAAVIKGDYLIQTDLSKARFEQVDTSQRRAVLVLPLPKATDPRVDLERSRLFGLRSYGLWQMTPGEAGYTAIANKAYQQAQSAVAAAEGDQAALVQARRQAEMVLMSFMHALGWDIDVRWQAMAE